jgi:hypothetical protein
MWFRFVRRGLGGANIVMSACETNPEGGIERSEDPIRECPAGAAGIEGLLDT